MISEKIIQQLLEDKPHLLSVGRDNILKLHKWILVDREVGIPTEEGGSDRWYLDHLFVDHEAIPTLVEVKFSGNDQVRREVIGQMFDYAAFATKYWPIEIIRFKFEENCLAKGEDPIVKVDAILNQKTDDLSFYYAYWERVYENMRTGHIRLVFLADQLSDELRGIIEFLRFQMNPLEVCGVEIKQHLLENPNLLDSVPINPIPVESSKPDYDGLYDIAEKQAGYFAANQASEVGFSWERLSSNVKAGLFQRVARGVYRLVRFPGSASEDLFVAWLRTGRNAVISHESALSVYELSDVLPGEVHVIVPRTASRRRKGIRQHTNQLAPDEITSREGLPVTTVSRTIADVSVSGLAEELIQQAIRESLQRGLTSQDELLGHANHRGGRAKRIIQTALSEGVTQRDMRVERHSEER